MLLTSEGVVRETAGSITSDLFVDQYINILNSRDA